MHMLAHTFSIACAEEARQNVGACCRATTERMGLLEPRISVLEENFDEEQLEAEAGNAAAAAVCAHRSALAPSPLSPMKASH